MLPPELYRKSDLSPSLIDRRSLALVLLDRAKTPASLALASFFLLLPYVVDAPQGLPENGWRVMGVFLGCSALWVTQAIPLGATGLLAFALLPWTSGQDSAKVFAYFGNKAVFFLIAAFLLASAVRETGLSIRVAIFVFRLFGRSARMLAIAILSLCFFLSFVMPEHAVAAMVFPIIAELLNALERHDSERERYSIQLYLAMVWGVVTGGVVTFLGGARTPLAIGILEETTGTTIGFLEWMKYSLPVAVPTFVVALVLQTFAFRTRPEFGRVSQVLDSKRKEMGPADRRTYLAALILGATLLGWIVWGETVDLAAIGMSGALAMVLLRIVPFRRMQLGVDWSIIFLYGGAIALGKIMMDTGAAGWLAERMLPTSWPLEGQLIALGIVALIATELVSNAAVVALLLPVSLGTLVQEGADPRVVTASIALMSGFVYNLPIGTPAMSMAFSSGVLRVSTTVRYGILLTGSAILFFSLAFRFVWP